MAEDGTFDPSEERESSAAWLNLIDDAEKQFRSYQDKADKIDKVYANLERQASNSRDREFALFWANCEVLKPSIYARPPVPVVVPKFKDRRPLYRVSSELLERSCITAFDIADINSVMMLLRDDVAIVGRGVAWVRYETKGESSTETERICVEYLDRRDFVHDPARNWVEVGWVARRGWMTADEMKERFSASSGDAYLKAAYHVQRENRVDGAVDPREKCGVWEIWSKTENRVVWVTEGVDVLLDEGKPHLDLEGFFPCPRPAYATLQRRSLIPVPDMLYYEDQLIEIDKLTNRIHALADAIQVKGFYPSGGEIGDAVETALTNADDRKVMVPVSNFAAFGSGGDVIIWLPIEVIAQTIAGLIEMRRAIIDDVYQIMGLSDIMRGSTEKGETATAQSLKAQYGSVRIRDKQAELVRIARDLVRIAGEIMAENFDSDTLIEMSQMEIPTDAEIAEQVKEIEDQQKAIEKAAKAVSADPEMAEQGQEQLQQAQQQIEAMAQEIAKLKERPTIEKIMDFLRDQRLRPFALDIETDSTIQPDENAEKERRAEFMQVLGMTIQQFAPVVQMSPAMAPVFGEMVKFAMAPYRAGRELEGVIDDAIDQMVEESRQPQPNPEEQRAQAEAQMEQQRQQFEMQKFQAEQQAKQQEAEQKAQMEAAKVDAEIQMKALDYQNKERESAARLEQIGQQMQRDREKGQLEVQKLTMELEKMRLDASIKATMANQQAEQSAVAFERQQMQETAT